MPGIMPGSIEYTWKYAWKYGSIPGSMEVYIPGSMPGSMELYLEVWKYIYLEVCQAVDRLFIAKITHIVEIFYKNKL